RRLGLIILDACRDNPFKMNGTGRTRAVARGLAAVDPKGVGPKGGFLVAFAAQAGTTAEDGLGHNHSPFTKALLKYVEEPGLEIQFLFRKVTGEVLAETKSNQRPAQYGSLLGDSVYLKPPTPDQLRVSKDEALWRAYLEYRNDKRFGNTRERFETQATMLIDFLEKYPQSSHRRAAEAELAQMRAKAKAAPASVTPDEIAWGLYLKARDTGQFPNAAAEKQ